MQLIGWGYENQTTNSDGCVNGSRDTDDNPDGVCHFEIWRDTMTTHPLDSFDQTQAFAEGWCISDCGGHKDGQYQLQRYHDADVFTDDPGAWEFVREKAASGSEYHLSALLLIRNLNRAEYGRINGEQE